MPRFLSRRAFLMTGAALGGTALVAAVGGVGYLATVDVDGLHGGSVEGDRATLNAFVVLHADGSVVINVPRTEMGQGIHTGLAMVVAEEMDLPFDERIRVEHPVEELAVYASWSSQLDVRPDEASGTVVWIGRRVIGALGLVSTGASSSTYGLWTPMRRAGAAARHMLVVAAAAELGVPVEDLSTAGGAVHHAATGRSVSYGALAGAAALVSPPDQPPLKSPEDWTLIGNSQRRVDIPAKVRGEPVFAMNVVLPDMLHASIRQPPVFGATVSRLRNAAELRRTPGVVDVVVIDDRGVAVIADSWWTAEQALWSLDGPPPRPTASPAMNWRAVSRPPWKAVIRPLFTRRGKSLPKARPISKRPTTRPLSHMPAWRR
jgi:isoquinoline 1-oxidoreductase subunit beta